MKTKICVVMIIAVVVAAGFAIGAKTDAAKAPTTKMELKTEMDKVSYSIGTILGGQFKQQGLDIQFDSFIQGIKDVLGDKELALTQQQMQEVMRAFGRLKRAIRGTERSARIQERALREWQPCVLEEMILPSDVVAASSVIHAVCRRLGTRQFERIWRPILDDAILRARIGYLVFLVFSSSGPGLLNIRLAIITITWTALLGSADFNTRTEPGPAQ